MLQDSTETVKAVGMVIFRLPAGPPFSQPPVRSELPGPAYKTELGPDVPHYYRPTHRYSSICLSTLLKGIHSSLLAQRGNAVLAAQMRGNQSIPQWLHFQSKALQLACLPEDAHPQIGCIAYSLTLLIEERV